LATENIFERLDMSTAVEEKTDAVEAVDDAAEPKEKKTRKSSGPRGKRTYYRWGREKLPLDEYDVPDTLLDEVPEDWSCWQHKELRHDDFKDPLAYYEWVRDVLVPQLVAAAEAGVKSLEGLGSQQARMDILAVGGTLSAATDMVKAKAMANSDSPEALEAIQRQLADMMAAVAEQLDAAGK
jgi:hypothetical protein